LAGWFGSSVASDATSTFGSTEVKPWKWSDTGRDRAGRWLVRLLVLVLFVAAVSFAIAFEIPVDDEGNAKLPAIALEKEVVYRLEVLLALIYGGLLLLTPLFYGLWRGRLPIEISHRGAKWAEAADQTLEKAQAAIKTLQEDATELRSKLVKLELASLTRDAEEDGREQRESGS
jgi:hypothetical protein